MASLAGPEVRLAELIASMSLTTDLGLGQPMETCCAHACSVLRLAEDLELVEGAELKGASPPLEFASDGATTFTS